MKSIARTIQKPHRYIYKHFYSTASDKKSGKMNLELSEIPTEEEIEHEVSNLQNSEIIRDQSTKMMKFFFEG